MSERAGSSLQGGLPARAHRRLRPWRSSQDVLARVVRRVLDCAASSGLNRHTLVSASGLGEFDLSNGDSRVPISFLVALWQLIGKAANDPGLVIRWSETLQVRDWGLFGYLLVNSDTLGDALRRFERYFRILSASADARLDVSRPRVIGLALRNAAAGLDRPYAVDYLLSSVLVTLRMIARVHIVPVAIDCACAQPASTLAHREFYRCPVRFSRGESRIVLDARDLTLPVPKADGDLVGYLSSYADSMLPSLLGTETLRDQVRSAIWRGLGDGRPSLRHLAAALKLPPRTLQRRLAAEGTSVQRELEEIRQGIAVAALRDRTHSIEEIAFFLGYREPSTFFRQFKRWTGTTPHRFRRGAA